ncbi:MAG: FAD-binding oxidoreductase [Thermoanaerobaculia bacterium]
MRTLQGTESAVDKAKVDALRAQLRGGLIAPEDAGYDEARSLWNAMIDRRPGLIARCTGTSDVLAALRFAREHDLLLSVKSGGHNIAGQAICEDGFVIDVSAMRGVWADPVRRIARAAPGALLGDVDRETQLHGLAGVMGFVSTTGAAGVTLGGGFGYLTRRFGWTADNLRGVDVVTADGVLRRASAEENPDLFWALRGGGGNFGIVTGFEHELHEVGPEITAGAIAWRGEEAPAVLSFFREMAAEAPEELCCVAGLRLAPPAPWLATDVHGKPIVLVVVCHTGDPARAEADLAPLKALGSPVGDVVMRRPYTQQQALLDATQPKGRRYYWKSEYFGELPPEALDTAVEHAARIVSPHAAILLFQLEGALNRLPEDHSAAGNRGTRWVLNVAGSWERSEDDEANIAWARACWEDMRRFSTGGVYVNFLTEDEGEDRTAQAYGANHARLAELKAKWDPDNVFRHNKNVAPAG